MLARRAVPKNPALRLYPHQSRITSHGPSPSNSFRIDTRESLATVDSNRLTQALSPLESTLTSNAQLIENAATLSPLESTLTRFVAVTPLEATLTKNGGTGVGRLPTNRQPDAEGNRFFPVPCVITYNLNLTTQNYLVRTTAVPRPRPSVRAALPLFTPISTNPLDPR